MNEGMREKRDGREEGWVGFPTRGLRPRGTPCAVGGVKNGQERGRGGQCQVSTDRSREGLMAWSRAHEQAGA